MRRQIEQWVLQIAEARVNLHIDFFEELHLGQHQGYGNDTRVTHLHCEGTAEEFLSQLISVWPTINLTVELWISFLGLPLWREKGGTLRYHWMEVHECQLVSAFPLHHHLSWEVSSGTSVQWKDVSYTRQLHREPSKYSWSRIPTFLTSCLSHPIVLVYENSWEELNEGTPYCSDPLCCWIDTSNTFAGGWTLKSL